MSRTLDWKWIGLGVLIMVGLNLVAGFILAALWGAELQEAAQDAAGIEGITLSGGQALVAAVLNFLAFAIGGYIVGVKSAGRTILEPGISAAIAVAIALLLAGGFTLVNLLVGGLVPFLAGLLGGWLGERRQGTARSV